MLSNVLSDVRVGSAGINRPVKGTITAGAAGRSAPNVAFNRTAHRTIHGTVYRAYSNARRNHDTSSRTWLQHDTRPYDAPGGIFNVLAVHYCAGLFSACGYEPNNQQRRYGDGKFHFGLLYFGTSN
jgi:hypothetical protein